MFSKTCKRCRVEKTSSEFHRWSLSKDGLADWCKECKSSWSRGSWKAEEYRKAYYQRNKQQADARNKAWAVAHPEAVKVIKDRWLKNNRGKRLESSLASYHRNYDKNRAKIYENARRRRALKKGATGNVAPQEWQEILQTFNNHCAYCLKPFSALTQDHMLPLIQGGEHATQNIVPACRSCNSQKQARNILQFARESTSQTAAA